MRIALPDGGKGLNDEGSPEAMDGIKQGVRQFRRLLDKHRKFADDLLCRKVAMQIDQYGDKLFADPIERQTPSGTIIIYPQRTNNILEQFFRYLRQFLDLALGNMAPGGLCDRLHRLVEGVFDCLFGHETSQFERIALRGKVEFTVHRVKTVDPFLPVSRAARLNGAKHRLDLAVLKPYARSLDTVDTVGGLIAPASAAVIVLYLAFLRRLAAFYQRIDQDGFHRSAVALVGPVHSAPAAGFSQVDPVGSAITAPVEPFSIHKGFNQQRRKPVLLFPICPQRVQAAGKHGARKVADRRQDQKSAVVDHMLQCSLAPLVVPADPLVPGFHPPGRAGKLYAAHHFPPGAVYIYQILDPCPERHRIAQVVVPAEKILEKLPLLPPLNPFHIQRGKNPPRCR